MQQRQETGIHSRIVILQKKIKSNIYLPVQGHTHTQSCGSGGTARGGTLPDLFCGPGVNLEEKRSKLVKITCAQVVGHMDWHVPQPVSVHGPEPFFQESQQALRALWGYKLKC
eukprot:scaffold4077_cov417-Prasinococcus_capsulatus_cf.AAC.2